MVVRVLSDAGALASAQHFLTRFIETPPFKQLIQHGAVVVDPTVQVYTASQMTCTGGNSGIARLAQCRIHDNTAIRRLKGDADLSPIFTGVPDIGAGGAPSPIVSGSFPWTTALHEIVHSFGFSDDYAYTGQEAPLYCGPSRWSNAASPTLTNDFASEAQALEVCRRQVPWCAEAINQGTQVVTQVGSRFKISTPAPASCPDETLGVYLGGSCETLRPDSTFRPYFCPTVMGSPHLGQDYCSVTQRHAIIARAPNPVPPYYQKKIIERIQDMTGLDLSGVPLESFDARTLPRDFAYGFLEVDRLDNPQASWNLCPGSG